MAAAKTKKPLRRKWLLYALLIIVLLVAGFKVYNHFSIAANKRAFQNARTTIDSIYYDAVKQIGPADNAQTSSSCSRNHVEFGRGQLSCNVGIDFIYGVNNETDANSKMAAIQRTIKQSKLEQEQTLSSALKDTVVASSYYHTASDIYKFQGLDCTSSYIYDTPQLTSLNVQDQTKKTFEISIGCSGPAKQQYYRLAS